MLAAESRPQWETGSCSCQIKAGPGTVDGHGLFIRLEEFREQRGLKTCKKMEDPVNLLERCFKQSRLKLSHARGSICPVLSENCPVS